jgi:hypothetical protein
MAKCIINVEESMHEIMSAALNGCWKKLWPETVNDFQGFPKQQDKIRNILVLARNIPGGFLYVEEGDIKEVLNDYFAVLTDEDLNST